MTLLRHSAGGRIAVALTAVLSVAATSPALAAPQPSGPPTIEMKAAPAGSAVRGGQAPPQRADKQLQTPVFVHKGGRIDPDDAATQGLACFQPGKGATRCYDTPEELAKAERIGDPATAAAAAKQRHRHTHGKAKAANHYGSSYAFWLYQHGGFAGWSVVTNSYCQWFDLPGFYGGNASSSNVGQHTGVLASGYGGGGATIGLSAWSVPSQLYPFGWDNRAYSRARVCI